MYLKLDDFVSARMESAKNPATINGLYIDKISYQTYVQ